MFGNFIFSFDDLNKQTENINKKLSENNNSPLLEDLLLEEGLVDELQSRNQKLIDYFNKERIKQMLDYIIKEPKEDDHNKGHKFPFLCSRLLNVEEENIMNYFLKTNKELKEEKNKKEENEKKLNESLNMDKFEEKNEDNNDNDINGNNEKKENDGDDLYFGLYKDEDDGNDKDNDKDNKDKNKDDGEKDLYYDLYKDGDGGDNKNEQDEVYEDVKDDEDFIEDKEKEKEKDNLKNDSGNDANKANDDNSHKNGNLEKANNDDDIVNLKENDIINTNSNNNKSDNDNKENKDEKQNEEKKEDNKEESKEENKEQEPKKVDNNDKKEGERKESESKQAEDIVEDSKGFNKESFISQMEGKMEDKYEIIKELGSGAFARCLQVKNKTTGNLYACKEIQKSKMSDLEGFKHEINILIKLDHPNIIKLYEIYETQEYFYLIMELCSGGELFDRIISNIESGKPFTEEQAAEIFHQMMSAINYCHKNNIVHRDLKPENLLLLNQDPKSPIKVIDFGMSKICDPNDIMFERVGSAYYIAPEVLEGMYDEKCDIWSAGVILYILLCGYPCFNGSTDEQIYKQIRKKKYSFPSPEWDAISDDAKNLIKKMLTDAMDRISAEDILKDPWVLERAPNAKKGGVVQLNEGQLKNYANSSKMRKAVLTYIASRLTQSEIDALNKNFQEIDNNNDGRLTLEEIKLAASKNKGINLELIEEIFKSIDTDGSGSIEYTEFISASLDKSLYLQKEKLREAFNLFDVDNSGKISNAEIAKVLGMDKRSKEISKILEKYDANKDGEIDFEEFFEMMKDLS